MSSSPLAWLRQQLTVVEMALAGALLLLCSLAGLLGVGLLYTGLAPSPPPAAEMAAQPPPTATLVPPTPTPQPSPSPTATTAPPAPTDPTPPPTRVIKANQINESKIGEVITFVEQWRGLTLPDGVPTDFLTRDELQEQWRQRSFDQSVIDTLRKQQAFYIATGLIDPEVDLVEIAVDNQARAVLGYYNPDEQKMYIIAESVNMFAREEMTFAHEYTHALQDYHFDLNRLTADHLSNDAALAARALAEGDAQLVEALFTRQNINQDELAYDGYRYIFETAAELEGVSPALGALAYFPYSGGEYFVRYLFVQGNQSWELVNRAYRNPPVSSAQIIHPEKYLAGEQPAAVSLPDLSAALGQGWREVDRDVLGEMGLLVWLLDGLPPSRAQNGAAGWAGDGYTLWVDDNDRRLLALQTVWESTPEAEEFFGTFVTYTVLPGRNQSLREETATYIWSSDLGLILLERQENRVLIIIAPDQPTLEAARGQFQ